MWKLWTCLVKEEATVVSLIEKQTYNRYVQNDLVQRMTQVGAVANSELNVLKEGWEQFFTPHLTMALSQQCHTGRHGEIKKLKNDGSLPPWSSLGMALSAPSSFHCAGVQATSLHFERASLERQRIWITVRENFGYSNVSNTREGESRGRFWESEGCWVVDFCHWHDLFGFVFKYRLKGLN